MEQFKKVLYHDTVYTLPTNPSWGTRLSDGMKMCNGAIGSWWTYHFTENEYFNICNKGVLFFSKPENLPL